jgi:serine phosphatase RsbU (regulator of sigma subunit)
MADDKVRSLRNRGLALGMTTQDLLEEHLEEVKIPFRKGDTLLLYTDGLNEARNAHGEEFGEDRIESVMEIYAPINAKTVVQKLQASLEEFIGTTKPLDDITFTVIHRNG